MFMREAERGREEYLKDQKDLWKQAGESINRENCRKEYLALYAKFGSFEGVVRGKSACESEIVKSGLDLSWYTKTEAEEFMSSNPHYDIVVRGDIYSGARVKLKHTAFF